VSEIVDLVKSCGAPYGLNLVGAVPAHSYNSAVAAHLQTHAIDAEAHSIVVIGNGGGDFWRAYRRHVEADPQWERRTDPLDDFTREVIEREIATALRERGLRCVVVYPFVNDAGNLHFMELGRLAGIGGPSLLGVLIHPVYGTWIALRGALLMDQLLDEPGDGAGYDPCPRCVPRSCRPACPVEAVSERGWDVMKCIKHRVEAAPDCSHGCYSRLRCVIGPQHRYPDDEIRHHQERALRSMREYYRTVLKMDN
jgi:hypothetical protein